MESLDSITLIIILYYPTHEQIAQIKELDKIHCIIVDNTPYSPESKLKQCFGYNVDYISLNENMGIAYAQNIGIRLAKIRGYEYVIFFDQDSFIDVKLLYDIYNGYLQIKNNDENIGVVGPRIINVTSENARNICEDQDSGFSVVSTLISSGSFIPILNFDIVGLFDDTLFIDYVDHEWCWRCSSYGLKCFKLNDVIMMHPVGKKTISMWGMNFIVSSSFRYYYQYRNYVKLLGRCYVPLKWKIKTTIKNLVGIIIYPMLSNEHRSEILRNIIRGIAHGLATKHKMDE